ncbi:MAG: hypothetical protein HON76_18170 [Candidatus Scalindua sp.]|jgi:hypothetical protein|nr:hypothetical protein [Candidatus Scalindua sp.]MBT6231079.1 hypothetical protein [Candidatus Scalindua sp.]MBT6564448.1 hypothetical protein [Candidatus Scalindua sp.]
MSNKRTNLADAMSKGAISTREKPKKEEIENRPSDNIAPSRKGKKPLIAYFDPAVIKQLKLIGIEEDMTLQGMTEEAVNDFFVKRGKAQIA